MKGVIRFTKIKVDKKERVNLKYQEIVAEGKINKYSMRCVDKARPEFYEALDELSFYVAEICEFLSIYAENNMEIRGVSLSWTNDIMGVVITALKSLNTSNSPLVLNTPHLPAEPYSENDENPLCLSPECVETVEKLIEEARVYLKGDRAQMNLFSSNNERAGKTSEEKEETPVMVDK